MGHDWGGKKLHFRVFSAATAGMLAAWAGCAADVAASGLTGLDAVLGITVENDAGGAASGVSSSPPVAGVDNFSVSGRVEAPGDFLVFELGPGRAGDAITVTFDRGRALVAALFDGDDNLLERAYVTGEAGLAHTVRADTPTVRLGVAGSFSGVGAFHAAVARAAGRPVPPPRAQRVWLNFAGGQGVVVHRSAPASFPAFDAGRLDSAYAGQTAIVRRVIVETVRADYSGYNVEVTTSDEGPPPPPYSVVHFGGSSASLLGLADSVDAYNANLGESAIVYVENFALYRGMRLSAEELGVMIGNVASHELGHLLGLYHTRDPRDVMDTTGTAIELAQDQSFVRAPLEASVFPFGHADAPAQLERALGLAPKTETFARAAGKRAPDTWLRRMMQDEMPRACGTCLELAAELPSD